MIAERARMTAMLNMFEPMILPKASEVEPLRALTILTTNSGLDVPKATMVRPIKNGDTPNKKAIFEAPSTRKLADLITINKPIKKRIIKTII